MPTIFIKNSFTFLVSTVTVVSHLKACLKALMLEDGTPLWLYCFYVMLSANLLGVCPVVFLNIL